MSKRDDDSQTDMEVGMTTAERRRRRRRGGGLRVPSDNVPRRSSTPPVVAPVPEDPSLAMSIAYSFGSEPSEPMSRETVPSFENHEGMPTVIDPVSGPVEQADFDMKTREMTAVDLEALGLFEASASSSALPIQRLSSPGIEPISSATPDSRKPLGVRVQLPKRDATDPVDDVDVEIDSSMEATYGTDGTLGSRSALARASSVNEELSDDELGDDEVSDDEVSDGDVSDDDVSDDVSDDASELDSDEHSVIGPPVGEAPPPRPVMADAPPPRSPMTSAVTPPMTPPGLAGKAIRAQTVALSEDDLEEVREAARLATAPPARSGSLSLPPPMPVTKPAEVKLRSGDPPSVPEIDLAALEDKAAEASGEFEVDVEGIVDARSAPVAILASPSGPTVVPEPRTRQPSQPPLTYGHAPASNPPPLTHGYAPASSPPPLTHVHAPASSPPPLTYGHAPASSPPPLTYGHATASSPPPLTHVHAPASSPPPLMHGPAPASNPPPLAHGHPSPSSLPSGHGYAAPRDSQPIPIARDPQHASPPPPPVAHKVPPSPPPGKKDKPGQAIATPGARPDGKPARGKPWFVDLFDEDYLRTLPFLTPQATQAEAEFVIDAMGLSPGAQVLDVGCGYGRHAMELAARGFHVVGLDMSTPLLVRGGEEAHRRGLTINFVRGDMRELDFEAQFDGAYCLFSTFGYFDDETNKKTIANIARALKPGGRVMIEILNRDYVIADLPTRVWWEGDGCVVLEEVELNYFSSRIQVNRSVVFDDGRQLEQEISVRAYSLHEVGKLLHAAGFRVLEVSGAYHTRGRFFGNQSRHIIVLAERKDPGTT